MKKYIKYLPLLLLSLFFIIPGKVDAKAVTINFDETEHFNYFYEYINHTPFYSFLKQHGENLIDVLESYKYDGTRYSNIYIYLAKDIVNSPTNSKYVIVRSFNDNYFSDGNTIGLKSPHTEGIYYFFDENAEFISAYHNYSGTMSQFEYYRPNFEFSIKNEIHYFISESYDYVGSRSYLSSDSTPDLVVTNVIINGSNFIIDNNENYSSFKNWIKSVFTSQSIQDFDDSILEYFIKYKLLASDSPMFSCRYMVDYGKEKVTLPTNYSFVTLDSEASVFIVPKSTKDDVNSKLYLSSPATHEIGIRYWQYESGQFSFNRDYEKRTKIKVKDMIGEFNFLDNDKLPSKNYYDYIYHLINYAYYGDSSNPFSVNGPVYKHPITLYYDSNYYDVIYGDENGIAFTFHDGLNYSITNDDIKETDHTGVSVDIFEDADTQLEIGKQYSEIYEYDEDGNIIAVKGLELNGKTFFSFFNTMYSNITSFMGLITLTFQSLPGEVQMLLLFTLFASVIVIVRKLIIG